MPSKRQLIREKIKSILITPLAVPHIGTRVYLQRAVSTWPDEMPCVNIYTKTENADIYIAGPRTYEKILKVTLEILDRYQGTSPDVDEGVENRVDDICEAIEQRLFENETLSTLSICLVKDTILSDTEFEITDDGDKKIIGAKMTFDVKYDVESPIAQPGLDAFETAHNEWEVQPNVSVDPAVDDVDLPQ